MTKMKTIFVVIFLVLLIPVLLKAPESEAKVYRGKCKNNLTWSYNTKTKTMIIDCKGDMPDDKQFYGLDMGWKEYYLQTKKVVFKEGIKSIGAGAFEKFQNLESIVFPRKLCIIKNWAFSGCIKLNKIKEFRSIRTIGVNAFSNTALRKFSLKNIRRMKNFLWILVSLMVLASYHQTEYMVEGNSTIQTMDGKKLYLKAYKDDDLVDIDSSDVVHGKFNFIGALDSVMMVSLFIDDECLMPFVLGPEELSIHISTARQYVTGSALNDTLYSFIRRKTRLDNQIAELPHKESQMIMDGVDEDVIMVRLNDEANRLALQNDRLITNFITSNFDNVLGAGVFMILTSSYPYPVMTPQIEEIMAKATPYFKNDVYVKNYIKAAKENMTQMGYGYDDVLPEDSLAELPEFSGTDSLK